MTMLRRPAILAIACTLGALACPNLSRADFLSAFTGNTEMTDLPQGARGKAQGNVSFAVFNNTSGGSWVTAVDKALGLTGAAALQANGPLAGGPAVDLNATYVYMYEVVNLSGNTIGGTKLTGPTIEHLKVCLTDYSSAGYLTTTGGTSVAFKDSAASDPANAGKNVEGNMGTNNYALGKNPTADTTGADVPSVTGVAMPTATIAASAAGRKPIATDLSGGGDGTFDTIDWTSSGSKMNAGMWSTIVFFTSYRKPVIDEGRIVDNGDFSNGGIPSACPEPIAAVHAALGLGGLLLGGGFLRIRRKRQLPN